MEASSTAAARSRSTAARCRFRDARSRTSSFWLALRTAQAFDLDPELLDFGPPPANALPLGPVPFDTSLSGPATEHALETRLPEVDSLLAGLRAEREESLV